MNITLLIFGVFLILVSTILIAINSSNLKDENLNYQNKQQDADILNAKFKEESITQQNKSVYQEQEQVNPIKYVTNAEDEILFRDVKKEEPKESSDFNKKPTNITDEIIYLHKEGLSVGQIASRLEKGIREIEIILKVNKLKD